MDSSFCERMMNFTRRLLLSPVLILAVASAVRADVVDEFVKAQMAASCSGSFYCGGQRRSSGQSQEGYGLPTWSTTLPQLRHGI
jgi:hypothetical protein